MDKNRHVFGSKKMLKIKMEIVHSIILEEN